MIGLCLHRTDPKTEKKITMAMNPILVWKVCQCNVYVITKSIRRKDFGYKNCSGDALPGVWRE